MSSITRTQRRYDHRLRELVQTTGDVEVAIRHGVPRSTARDWLTKTTPEVVSLDLLELDTVRLQHEVTLLRRRIARLVWPKALSRSAPLHANLSTKVGSWGLNSSTRTLVRSYREAVTFQSPGSPRSGAPWVTGADHTYAESVAQE